MFDRGNLKIIDDGVAALYIEHSYAVQSTMSEEDVIAIATEKMETALAGAAEDTGVDENTAKAWIMYNSSDWSTMYSSGDTYNPSSKTDGILATDVEITGEGSYTVSLDFTGTRRGSANSVVFSALGIANGETLFPNYVATITEIKINGQTYTMQGKSYTSSDDGKCTRVNLYNEWVPVANGRTADGDLTGATPRLLDKDTLGDVETISITFNYAPAGK
ncbi:hypothetical protein [Anaerosporobacter sp.]|uniref:hypothetical protein n=1 Tax=Anaerosporobacter sp. TaxID=1872529 RepID=UPI00286F5A0B|nr:hypothetical protein [Anaerosporobacter sp.]